jgi:hypothetical protein
MSICELVYPVVAAGAALAADSRGARLRLLSSLKRLSFRGTTICLIATRLKNPGGPVGLSKRRDEATQKVTPPFKNRQRF